MLELILFNLPADLLEVGSAFLTALIEKLSESRNKNGVVGLLHYVDQAIKTQDSEYVLFI